MRSRCPRILVATLVTLSAPLTAKADEVHYYEFRTPHRAKAGREPRLPLP